ncbi:MAG: formate dehydrogenase accessory sulfurtransferase FdhD [Candidatus Brocadiae bacterium]|nr:formate dehydrogenase accessory sulfurtransferase FdhD [Candidatus Brocadiia bacterium]
MNDSERRPDTGPTTEAVRDVIAREFSRDAPDGAERRCRLAVEDVLLLEVENVGTYALMWTPTSARDLAVGFAFTEGLISGLDDVITLSDCEDSPGVLHMRVANPQGVHGSGAASARMSSCGMCASSADVEAFLSAPPRVGDALRTSSALLPRMVEQMRSRQEVFRQTGGTHAAAIFDANGRIIAIAEDIGRHNALDKAIGKCLLTGRSTRGCGVVLSGRASLELVMKCARAGIELLAAVSAPSSLAVETAQRCNITLCGFVRGDRATVYTHPHRVAPAPQAE